jgi:hypothetical protein
MGAVGGILVRQLEDEVSTLRNELTKLRAAPAPTIAIVPEPVEPTTIAVSPPLPVPVVVQVPVPVPSPSPLVKQPALWFAVAGWIVAIVLLFRRKTI